MDEETLTMSRKELDRVRILEQVGSGAMTLVEASGRLGLGYRQTKRLWSRWKRGGPSGLIHGGRGRDSNRALPRGFRERVLAVYSEHCREYGPTLASEVLEEEHGLRVHPETLRRWLGGSCLYVSGRRHRQHRKRRERRARFGQMVQMDGSTHAWFGGSRPNSCLMVAVDDATGRTMAHMAEEETTRAAYALLMAWIGRHGVPESIYVDRRSVYVTDREPTAGELRQGSGALTDFGRACWRLGIRIIAARSPEAKGRVERKNGVLQDRLVKYLARRGISTIDGANAVLGGFLDDLDARHAKAPANPVDAHRRAPSAEQLIDICCREEARTVGRDWTVQFRGCRYQIRRQPGQPGPQDQVTVRTRFDRTLAILHRDRELAYDAAPD